MLATGTLSPQALATAFSDHSRMDVGLGELLLAHGEITGDALGEARSQQYDAGHADFQNFPPDPRLIDVIGAARCLRQGLLPWRRVAGGTLIATHRPEHFAAESRTLPADLHPAIMVLCSEEELHRTLLQQRGHHLAQAAEFRVSPDESCRFWYAAGPRAAVVAFLAVLLVTALVAPLALLAALTLWTVGWMVLGTALKLTAALVQARALRQRPEPDIPTIARLPVVSILVPLYRETEIMARLIERLSRLDYPRALLDICLVTEADDILTREMLHRTHLPRWMRCVTVPAGTLKTKPRALNFALDFCRGSIVGVYDAEDAPAPDQIRKVVDHFHSRGADVASVQGVLDFYNTDTNWLSRCFTIEYAGWFRVILPGMARMGLPVPLGGTTLFFRRTALEALGGWDAHNVTEDADLGLRLARHGYRTEFLDSITEEEANCRAWPWVRQRSRWLKGYAMTWASHMRNPARLWRQLGGWGFAGMQVLFLGTLSQFAFAPLLWSFWGLMLGFGHPLAGILPSGGMTVLVGLFVAAELVNLGVGAFGLSRAGKLRLLAWLPTLHVYFPLASMASYNALWEMASRPFFWDKTRHGLFEPPQADPDAEEIIAKVHAQLHPDDAVVSRQEKAQRRRGEGAPRTRSRYGS
ncbi:Glycosyl transferase, group 2 family protein [Rhodovulum sp. P5]|nr:Glycosyl transferase, group 2 family protein [Rhodovulum sp. P5]